MRHVFAGLLVAAVLILGGCASTNTGGTFIPPNSRKPPVLFANADGWDNTRPYVLVRIRYPSAAGINSEVMRDAAKKVGQLNFPYGEQEIDLATQELITKNQFYAEEFYHALSARLPKGSVILCPEEPSVWMPLVVSGYGAPIYKQRRGMSGTQDIVEVPAAIEINFSVVPNIERVKNVGIYWPDTFGNFVSVRADIDAWSSRGLWTYDMAVESVSKKIKMDDVPIPPEVNRPESYLLGPNAKAVKNARGFVDFTHELSPATLECGNEIDSAQKYLGWHLWCVDDPAIEAEGTNSEGPSPTSAIWDKYADFTVHLINEGTLPKRLCDWHYYHYAEMLGAARPLSEKSMKVIDKLICAEISLISKQDEATVAFFYDGEPGKVIRKLRSLEAASRRTYADQYNSAMFSAAAAGFAEGTAMGSYATAMRNGTANPQMAMNTINQMQNSSNAVQAAADSVDQTGKRLTNIMNDEISRTFEASQDVNVTLFEEEKKFTVTSIGELREKFKALYKKFGE